MGQLVIGYRQNMYVSDVTRNFIDFVQTTYGSSFFSIK